MKKIITTKVIYPNSLRCGDMVLATYSSHQGLDSYLFKVKDVRGGIITHTSGFNLGEFYYNGYDLYKVKGKSLKTFWSVYIGSNEIVKFHL